AALNGSFVGTWATNTDFLTPTGNTHSNTTIDTMSSTAGILVGAQITGSGIPAGTSVASVASSSITISQAATATASGVSLTVAPAYIDLVGSTFPSGGVLTTAGSVDLWHRGRPTARIHVKNFLFSCTPRAQSQWPAGPAGGQLAIKS